MKKLKCIRNGLFVFKLVWTQAPRRVLFDLLMCIYGTVFSFLEHTYIYKYVIDCIQYNQPFTYVVYFMFFLFVGWVIQSRGTDFYNTYFREKDEQKINRSIQFDLYEHAAKIDFVNYENKEFYDDYVWNLKDIKNKIMGIYCALISIITAAIGVILYGGFIISADIFGIVLIAVTIVAQYILNGRANRLKYRKDMELRQSSRIKDYVKRIFYMPDYASELRMANINSKFYTLNKKALGESINVQKRVSGPLIIINFLSTFVMDNFAFDVVYILHLAYSASILKIISYGTIIALIRSQWNFSGSINALTDEISKMHQNSLYIDKYKEFCSFKSKIQSGRRKLGDYGIESIELRNVFFGYPQNENVLKNINLIIKKNEKIAIVGQNGAGKTTLTNIILRLYDFDSGEILVNGKRIEDLSLNDYKMHLAVVFQDYAIYAANVIENISLDIQSDESQMEKAIKLSGFDDRLKRFENGMYTQLTREFDNDGVNLSGGEKQKIALSRAIYKQSDVIIMDEPSSALDPIAEAHFNETISKIAKDKILIFISHRLSTVSLADKIYFLENGRIIEEGSHDELMLKNGKYANMYKIQAKKYHKSK